MDDTVTHPRPQLTRDRWTDLGGGGASPTTTPTAGCDEGWHERADVFDRAHHRALPA